MISHGRLAVLSGQMYSDSTNWANFWEKDDVVAGHLQEDGFDIIVLRGSLTAEDWVRDATAIPVWHPELGHVHAGFMTGMEDVYSEISQVLKNKTIITGHSLGGARARLLAGLFAIRRPGICSQVITFGSPKPAFVNLARIIEKSGMGHFSYRNRNDVVPTLPLSVFPFLDFVHTEQWLVLNESPENSNMEALRDHSISLYIKALSQ